MCYINCQYIGKWLKLNGNFFRLVYNFCIQRFGVYSSTSIWPAFDEHKTWSWGKDLRNIYLFKKILFNTKVLFQAKKSSKDIFLLCSPEKIPEFEEIKLLKQLIFLFIRNIKFEIFGAGEWLLWWQWLKA